MKERYIPIRFVLSGSFEKKEKDEHLGCIPYEISALFSALFNNWHQNIEIIIRRYKTGFVYVQKGVSAMIIGGTEKKHFLGNIAQPSAQ